MTFPREDWAVGSTEYSHKKATMFVARNRETTQAPLYILNFIQCPEVTSEPIFQYSFTTGTKTPLKTSLSLNT